MRAKWLWTALALLLAAGGSYGLYLYLQPAPLPPQLLYANGNVEATEVRVSAEVAGRVVESRLEEGKSVGRGELLVRLDDTDLQLRKARAAAEVEALQREREKVEREHLVLRHHVQTAERELARYRELAARGTAAQQRLDEAENAYREAGGRLAASEAAAAALDARIDAARRELDLIANQIGKTEVTAPIAGTVLATAAEAGEFVQAGEPVALLADLTKVEVKVFVPERDIGKIRLSAPARIRVDAFPARTFDGRVARVDQHAQFTPRAIHMPEERVRTVFGVTLAVGNPEGVLKPGMPADAWILWQTGAGWPDRLFVPR